MSSTADATNTADGQGAHARFGPTGWGDYRTLWTASTISALGDGMRLTALPLLAASATADPLLLALVTVAGTLPMLLSPLAGVAADRWNRKRLLIWVDLTRFLLVGLLALAVAADIDTLTVVCAVALLLGVGEVLFVVTAQTFLPQVVAPTRMTAAFGRQYAASLVGRDTAGQPLGGLLFAVGMALPFALDSASFLIGIALLATVRTVVPHRPPSAERGPGWGAMTREGYRYLRDDRLLLTLAGMLGLINFFLAGAGAVFVLYVLHRLGISPGAYGFFLAAGALGGVLGGTLSSRLGKRLGLFPAALASLTLTGASCLLLALVTVPGVAAGAFLMMNFGAVIYQTLTVSYRQQSVPQGMLGRVNGVYRLFGTGTAPLGALCAGVVADQYGVQTPFLIAGCAVLVLAMVSWRPITTLAAAQPEVET